jgi:hypothetical protein
MYNEFESLTDYEVVEMYEKAIIAYRSLPASMPANDRSYLLQRKVSLKNELSRRRLVLL